LDYIVLIFSLYDVTQSGYYLLSSSKDCSLKIWDLREGRLLFTLLGHSGPVNAAKFSADGHFFASGGADQLVMIWKSNFYGVDAPVIEWSQADGSKSNTKQQSSYTTGVNSPTTRPQSRRSSRLV
jgi:centriolar protein POC1